MKEFRVRVTLRPGADGDEFLDRFLDSLEPHGLCYGGGLCNGYLDGYVSKLSGSFVFDFMRQTVADIFADDPGVAGYEVGNLE